MTIKTEINGRIGRGAARAGYRLVAKWKFERPPARPLPGRRTVRPTATLKALFCNAPWATRKLFRGIALCKSASRHFERRRAVGCAGPRSSSSTVS